MAVIGKYLIIALMLLIALVAFELLIDLLLGFYRRFDLIKKLV
jgi:hypothetical protein